MARPRIYNGTLTAEQKTAIRTQLGAIHVQLEDIHQVVADEYGPAARSTARLSFLSGIIARARTKLIEMDTI